jgi:predicted dienelactone hydrolase
VAGVVAAVLAGGVLIGPGAATAAPPGPAAAPAGSAASPGGPAAAPGGSAAAAPAGSAAITLARPSGPYLTGTTLLHLRDQRRVDPLDPAHRQRELMVQLWYPAAAAAGKPLAPYAPPAEAAALQAQYPVPAGAFGGATNSRLGAPVQPGRHQVVVYYHGLCGARTDNTAASEQLASLGYVVVGLGDTHESPAVEFPGGRVEKTSDPKFCLAGGDPYSAANQAILNRLLAVRVADSRFALDQLERINHRVDPDVEHRPLPRGLAGTLDTRRVGMFGHSFGGGTTAAVLKADRRFVAGIDLDGFVIGPVATTGLRKPFLVVGSDYHDATFDPSWATFLPRLTGWHRWFSLDRAGHYRFMDLGGSARKWGLEQTLKKADPETWRLVFGDVDDALSQEVTTRLVGSFFEHFLRRRPAPILNRPTDFYPALRDRTGEIPGI